MYLNQKTIKKESSYSGIGLHTGKVCNLRFLPAPPDSGVKFVRIDLPGRPEIPAKIGSVMGVVRGTTLGNREARVHTIEHICSVLLGTGIDNLTVEIDSSEPPVADGSAKPFLDAILQAGIEDLNVPKNELKLTRPIHYQANESSLSIEPAETFSVHCRLLYDHPMIGKQEASFTINPETFAKEIAPARTFCFDYEVEALKRKGLARGGSLDNAVVVGMDRIYNKEEKLRFPNEFVRHKILDFLGDFFLIGRSVRGKVTAVKIGHGHNVNFVKEILKQTGE